VKVLKRLGLGVLIVAAAAGLSGISYFCGAFAAFGYHFYDLPTGIYLVGLGMIGTTMAAAHPTTVSAAIGDDDCAGATTRRDTKQNPNIFLASAVLRRYDQPQLFENRIPTQPVWYAKTKPSPVPLGTNSIPKGTT
jgi:hypothetical protein